MRHALVVGLRKRGVDILSALEAGATKEIDEQQLAFAAAQGRAIWLQPPDRVRLRSLG